ncbi:MAG: glycosyltransferase family 4 protein [Bacteroidota bacterium]
MRVLHLIERYLPPSQVWLYLLLKKTQQEVQHHIGTRAILDNEFRSPAFELIEAQRGAYRLALKAIAGNRLSRYVQHLSLASQQIFKPTEAREWMVYVQENQIDLIHLHFGPHACEHLDWLASAPVPFVVSFYGYDYEKAPFQKPHLRSAYRRLFKLAAGIICEGGHGKKILAEQYDCVPAKLHVVPLGIDLKEWPTPAPKIKEQGQLRLLQVADFTAKKGQLDTIAAAITAKEQVPELTLTLVGRARDVAYAEACHTAIQKASAGSWIRTQTFIPIHELRGLMQRHDAFIHPSRYTDQRDCEGGAPTILFYAQCLGLPIISTRHCDIPAVVRDGVSGQLVAEGDVFGLQAVIEQMAAVSGEQWQQQQTQTISWGREVADLNRGARALRQLYQQLKMKESRS